MNKIKFFANTSLLFLCFSVSIFVVPGSIFAAPGDPAPSFNGRNPVRTGFGLANDEAQAVAVQPDGKLLVLAGAYKKNAVWRYNMDGISDRRRFARPFAQDVKITSVF